MSSPRMIVFPGASLMELTRCTATVIRVRCPGCQAVHDFDVALGQDLAFVHEVDDCPIRLKIHQALEVVKRLAAGDGEVRAAAQHLHLLPVD